jgi:PAS domain S-box-containing protein
MTRLLQSLGSDVERALTDVNVPSYIIDKSGTIAWVNPAAERLVGDVRGRRFTEVVTVEDRPRAREAFARKILGKEKVTDAEVELHGPDGRQLSVEVSSVPLREGHQIVGVFGLLARPPTAPKSSRPHARLTKRQREVLAMLAHGMSTRQIAEELHLSKETVRNHVRGILSALDVHSRVEAVAAARAEGVLDD